MADQTPQVQGWGRRFALSLAFWPVVGVSLAIIWMFIVAGLGRTGFWIGYLVFLVGLIAAFLAKRAVVKRRP